MNARNVSESLSPSVNSTSLVPDALRPFVSAGLNAGFGFKFEGIEIDDGDEGFWNSIISSSIGVAMS